MNQTVAHTGISNSAVFQITKIWFGDEVKYYTWDAYWADRLLDWNVLKCIGRNGD